MNRVGRNNMKEYRKIPSLKFLYEINEDGVIRNVKSKKILKLRTTPNSYYLYLHTAVKGKTIDICVHRLVAECWCKVPEHLKDYDLSELQVNHKDFNIQNNNYRNLEWVTAKENTQYSVNAGRFKGVNKGKPGFWKDKHHSEETKKKLSEIRKLKSKIKAIDIKTKEEFIFNDLDEAENFKRNKLNKTSTCVRTQIIRGCRGERKVVYKHNWYFI